MRHLALLCTCFLLAACGGKGDGRDDAATADGSLPIPAGTPRSVTGMPDPGRPLAVPAGEAIPSGATAEADAAPTEPLAGDESGDATPGPDAAVEVVRRYYAAINARDYASAHALWGDGGRASGQDAQQFAAGFAATTGVSVQIGAPGGIEGAAGSRYIQVPVTLDATQADGSHRRYAGSYTLRLAVVDGATPEQRSWHIASADLREAAP